MFRCEQCGTTTQPGEKLTKRVMQTRAKVYPQGGHGTEIVKEINICQKCAANSSPHEVHREL